MLRCKRSLIEKLPGNGTSECGEGTFFPPRVRLSLLAGWLLPAIVIVYALSGNLDAKRWPIA